MTLFHTARDTTNMLACCTRHVADPISDGNAMGLVRSPGGRCPVTAAGHTARRTAVTAPLSCAVLWSRQHSGGAARVWRGRPNTYTYDTALPCALRSVVRQSVAVPPHRHPREKFMLRGGRITSRLTCASPRALVEARSSGDLSPWQGPRHDRRSDSRHPPLR